jgi:myosin V
VDGAVGLHKIEARYPALLFKQQLVDLIQKVYGMINDKLKELNPLLELCIQVPPHLRKTNHAICKACLLKELEKSDPRTSFSNQSKALPPSATGSCPQDQLMHWLSIVKILNNYLHLLRANHVRSE